MNVENWRIVADAIEAAPPEQFDMRDWFWTETTRIPCDLVRHLPDNMCGSAGCIAGWTAFVFRDGSRECLADFAADKLGIDYGDSDYVFTGGWSDNRVQASRDEALAYMRAAIDQQTPYPVMPL